MRWTFFSDTNIWREQLVHRYSQNNICFFRSPISPWRGPQWKSLFGAFFSRHGLYFHHTKNQPPLRPPSTFSENWPWFWPYLLSKQFMKKKLVTNLGHYLLKKCKISCLGGLLKEKQESTSDLFSYFLNH